MTFVNDLSAIVEARIGVRMRVLGSADPVLRHVRERVAALDLEGPDAFVARIAAASPDDTEYRLLVRAVTNGQTFFFRDDEQLAEIVDHLVVCARTAGGRTMQVWSAACATGEEPYSLVMLALDRGIDVRVVATDVNDARIAFARAGRYDAWAVRHVPKPLLERYFDRDADGYVLRASVRSRVEFACHNVLEPELPAQHGRPSLWDLILCRNLFIYLSKGSVTDVVRTMSRGLAKDGVLVLGTAESLRGHDVPLEPTSTGTRIGYRHRREASTGIGRAVGSDALPPTDPVLTPTALRKSPELLAYQSLRDGRLDDAETLLVALVHAMPDRWDLRLSLGHTYLRSHRLPLAMSAYLRAQSQADVEAEPSFFVGLAALKADSLDEARDALRRALFLDETSFRTALLLAGVLERKRETTAAIRMLVHAREAIAAPRGQPTFRSFVCGISAATLAGDQARASIERRLLALNRPSEARDE